ncbi:fused MFS/spermidine synthase [Undibacterium sp. LX40W]|uniref:Fused MFS/spermidine synthase n=1 Tax=Undibacterium nitidum TaxID=2762298 RepID=A0A923HM91_9BURK|nr:MULTISPECIES: fused MFS/spermidine synthase [Undibacterium]MBC3880238.1 fused MFS/spermidine synthase [Undibacterium nitidum]MBC3891026.1 fused MFS/spermidine synthase [Undibacterium sp. LX40W]
MSSNGKPFVFEDGGVRTLHFSDLSIQSAMWVDRPNDLMFGYTQCMLAFSVVNPTPENILIVGLGGGSLVKYCYQRFPRAKIVVLEVDANVIALSPAFDVPECCDRLTILNVDAREFVRHDEKAFDVILQDGFDSNGIVPEMTSESYFRDCHRLLTPDGIFVSNNWGSSRSIGEQFARLLAVFGNSSLTWGRCKDSQNIVSLAFKSSYQLFQSKCSDTPVSFDCKGLPQLKLFVSNLVFFQPKNKNDFPLRDRTHLSENISEWNAKEIRKSLLIDFIRKAFQLAQK